MVKNNHDFKEVVRKIIDYNQARGWNKTTPQDLAKSVVLEAAELLEHYQWDTSTRSLKTKLEPKDIKELKSEVADIFWFLVLFCNRAKIDLLSAVTEKTAHNEGKYPLSIFSHSFDAYKTQKKKYRQAKNAK